MDPFYSILDLQFILKFLLALLLTLTMGYIEITKLDARKFLLFQNILLLNHQIFSMRMYRHKIGQAIKTLIFRFYLISSLSSSLSWPSLDIINFIYEENFNNLKMIHPSCTIGQLY